MRILTAICFLTLIERRAPGSAEAGRTPIKKAKVGETPQRESKPTPSKQKTPKRLSESFPPGKKKETIVVNGAEYSTVRAGKSLFSPADDQLLLKW